jgi:hypothetical protein
VSQVKAVLFLTHFTETILKCNDGSSGDLDAATTLLLYAIHVTLQNDFEGYYDHAVNQAEDHYSR